MGFSPFKKSDKDSDTRSPTPPKYDDSNNSHERGLPGVAREELEGLIGELRRIRDEELEHLDVAVENDSKEARPYELLTNVIRGGCRTAIWISEKI